MKKFNFEKAEFFVIFLAVIFCTTMAMAADVKIAWDANSEPEVTGYKVYQADSADMSEGQIVNDAGNVVEYTLTGLTEGQTYYLAVTAYDADSHESGFSDILQYVASPGSVIIRIVDRPKNIQVIFSTP